MSANSNIWLICGSPSLEFFSPWLWITYFSFFTSKNDFILNAGHCANPDTDSEFCYLTVKRAEFLFRGTEGSPQFCQDLVSSQVYFNFLLVLGHSLYSYAIILTLKKWSFWSLVEFQGCSPRSLALLVEILQYCVTSEISVQLSVPQELCSVRPHGFLS